MHTTFKVPHFTLIYNVGKALIVNKAILVKVTYL